MSATMCSCFSKASGASGLLISLAIVFAGNAAIAEGLTQVGGSGRMSAGMFGDFSSADLERLEHASTAAATEARLAAMGVKTSPVAASVRSQVVGTAYSSPADDADLFPHSARVLPMLVARPEAETFVARTAIAPRPGLAQPVGVSRASLRPRTPAERSAR
jgi:hypothetical protein